MSKLNPITFLLQSLLSSTCTVSSYIFFFVGWQTVCLFCCTFDFCFFYKLFLKGLEVSISLPSLSLFFLRVVHGTCRQQVMIFTSRPLHLTVSACWRSTHVSHYILSSRDRWRLSGRQKSQNIKKFLLNLYIPAQDNSFFSNSNLQTSMNTSLTGLALLYVSSRLDSFSSMTSKFRALLTNS